MAGRADYVAVGADICRYPAHGGIFKPRYEQVMETYMDMQDRLDQMESELDVVKADLNCDGLWIQGDLDLLFNYILRRPGEYPTERMDFTGDGRINSSDLNALYEIVEALHDQRIY